MTITTKYNIGDVVWVSVYGEPLEVRILGVMLSSIQNIEKG